MISPVVNEDPGNGKTESGFGNCGNPDSLESLEDFPLTLILCSFDSSSLSDEEPDDHFFVFNLFRFLFSIL